MMPVSIDPAYPLASPQPAKADATLPPMLPPVRGASAWIGGAFGVAILAAAMWQLARLDMAAMWALMPSTWLFWPLLMISLFISPIADWVIFNRLWGIPWRGLLPLIRKKLANEFILGYSGEVYFYTWARHNVRLPGSPFGAIKDSAIVSAMVGNAVTIVMMIVALPLFRPMVAAFDFGLDADTLTASIAFVLSTALIVLALRRRLFSLPLRQLGMVASIHFARTLVAIGLAGVLWNMALPSVTLELWLVLATWRQVFDRLPFIQNKDVIFVALVIFLVGQDEAIVALLAMMAALGLVIKVAVGLALALVQITPLETDR